MLETPLRQLAVQAAAGDEGPGGGAVKAAQPRVTDISRYWPPGTQVFGVFRVVGRRERNPTVPAVPPNGKAQRALSRYVNSVRPKRPHLTQDVRSGPDRQPNFRVARGGNAEHPLGGDHTHLVSEASEGIDRGFEGRDYAIGLGVPGVSG